MPKGSAPLFTRDQFVWLQQWVRTEIEFALSVESGGRYGRQGLRKRMRQNEEMMKILFLQTPAPFAVHGEDEGEFHEEEGEDVEVASPSSQEDDDEHENELERLQEEE